MRSDIITVAFPSFSQPRGQIARYCGDNGVLVLANNHNLSRCSQARRAPRVKRTTPQVRNELDDDYECDDVDKLAAVVSTGATVTITSSVLDGDAHRTIPQRSRAMLRDMQTLGLLDASPTSSQVLYHAVCPGAPALLHNVMPSPEVAELVTSECSWNPFHWLTMCTNRLTLWYFGVRGVPVSYMMPSQINLGGFFDQMQCEREVRKAVELAKHASNGLQRETEAAHQCTKVVLFGCSRGATTIGLTALRLPPELAQHVALVILEGPFDSLDGVLKETSVCSCLASLKLACVRALGRYDGDVAYQLPETTALTCPIAFITSLADKDVPEVCARRLMASIKQSFPHISVEHLQLKRSGHAFMPTNGDFEDHQRYQEFMDMMYAKCRLTTTPIR